MTLRDLLRKKDKIDKERDEAAASNEPPKDRPIPIPEFTFVRTTTNTQEIIAPPSFPDENKTLTASGKDGSRPSLLKVHKSSPSNSPRSSQDEDNTSRPRRLSQLFNKSSSKSGSKDSVPSSTPTAESLDRPVTPTSPSRSEKRLSSRINEKLHISRSRSPSTVSSIIPSDLPEISLPSSEKDGHLLDSKELELERESQWEQRALLLAEGNIRSRSHSVSSAASTGARSAGASEDEAVRSSPLEGPTGAALAKSAPPKRPAHTRTISSQQGDVNILEAIKLHESGDLKGATLMFSRLASLSDSNNALAQILYALSLRHGWGCPADPQTAVTYLSAAAANSAAIEKDALSRGIKNGGPAKGELTLSTYELGNCFRNGWGVERDYAAARAYYECAAELGDTDAMGEVAFCLLQGLGGKKDKARAAMYLRRAEGKGVTSVGNAWIWKEKYDTGKA